MKKVLKRLLIGLLVLMAIVLFFGNKEESSQQEEESTSHQAEQAKIENNKAKTIDPMITEGERLNKSGQTVTLNAGNWEVGADLKPGHYRLTTSSGQGNVMSENAKYGLNIILDAKASNMEGVLTQFDTYLVKGDKIQIVGLQSVTFTAINQSQPINQGTLTAGNYIVGLDIQPARYEVNAVQGSGNLLTSDGDINEMFGTNTMDDVFVSKITHSLKSGQLLTTTANKISLKKVSS